MLQALVKEIEFHAKENNPAFNNISTIYIGGGTPTVCSPQELGLLVNAIKTNFSAENIVEFTVEANPDDLTPSYLEGLKKIGVNRLSIGIQSFIDRDLKWMNRRHSANDAINSVRQAQQAGFDNITIDLIYGIPSMSLDEWRYNLETALLLNTQHISAYHLTIEEKTIFGKQQAKGLVSQIDEEQSEEQFMLLRDLTQNAGFEHYEISNFAKDQKYGIHNSSYWRQQPYLGIGPSAHSYDGDRRQWNTANNKQYLVLLNDNAAFYEREVLDISTKYNEYILTSLRTMWGVNLDYILNNFGQNYLNHFERSAKILLNSKDLEQEGNSVKILPSRYFVSDRIITSLLYINI